MNQNQVPPAYPTINVPFRAEVLDMVYSVLTQHPQPVPYQTLELAISTIRDAVNAHNEKAAITGGSVGGGDV